jgi:hypothetical protein
MNLCFLHRALLVLCFALAGLWTTGADAQRYAPDGSVIPDPVLRPEDTPGDPALSRDAVRPDPVRPAD